MIAARDHFHCRYCGIPVIRKAVRERFRKLYQEVKIWGRQNNDQHAAFQAMWAQLDHIEPHSHGGQDDVSNLVLSCAPCNYSRMDFTLAQAMLEDPRLRENEPSDWDGLEAMLAA